MTRDAALIIRVSIRREAEHFYAHSDDLPGLHVGGESEEAVCASAARAVKALFKHNRGLDVEVTPLTNNVIDFPNRMTFANKFAVQQRLAA